MIQTTDFINAPCWKRGQDVEDSFQKLLEGRGVKCRPATLEEQYKHYDYITDRGTIDVKARKRIRRNDSSEQDELVWLEFKNIHGSKGWLASDVDFIAFERKNDFVIVRRIYLYEMAVKKCKLDDRVTRSSEALYKGYQRKGAQDLISMIKMQDVLNLPVQIIDK
jgi:hypothetical protein